MLYMRLKTKIVSEKILKLIGNTCIWTKISRKKVIAHCLHLQLHVELQPYDLITMRSD